jgi:hypothetical protein
MASIHAYGEFRASCNDEPGPGGPPNVLTVSGSGSFVHGGCTAHLTEAEDNPGIGTVLVLELSVTGPGPGPRTQAITPFTVTWTGNGHLAEGGLPYTHVRIKVTSDGEPPLDPAIIDVVHAD